MKTSKIKLILNSILLGVLMNNYGIYAQKNKTHKVQKPNVNLYHGWWFGPWNVIVLGTKVFYHTNIDKLANQGTVFSNSYSSTFCAPSRATLLSGYNDCRKNKYVLTSGRGYLASATDPSKDQEIQDKINAAIGKEPDIMYLPQVFKEAGYITGPSW